MQLALTFDDGPGPSTPRLLDVLARHGARATFFLLGCNVERAPDVVRRIASEGHVVANHSFSHAHELGARALVEEIARVDDLLATLVGARRFPVRLPYGPRLDDPRLRALASIGRTHVHWTADFADWLPSDPRELATRMRAHVEAQAALGLAAVLDLHDSSKAFAAREATVDAVELLLAHGDYEVFTVPA